MRLKPRKHSLFFAESPLYPDAFFNQEPHKLKSLTLLRTKGECTWNYEIFENIDKGVEFLHKCYQPSKYLDVQTYDQEGCPRRWVKVEFSQEGHVPHFEDNYLGGEDVNNYLVDVVECNWELPHFYLTAKFPHFASCLDPFGNPIYFKYTSLHYNGLGTGIPIFPYYQVKYHYYVGGARNRDWNSCRLLLWVKFNLNTHCFENMTFYPRINNFQ
jgi:hypothetical protein